MWDGLINAIPETLRSLFGIIDKAVPDKDDRERLKYGLAQLVAGSKMFEAVMVLNFLMLATLTILQREAPEWSLWVFIVWSIGPLLNTLSKEAIEKIAMIIKMTQDKKKGSDK